ncbi:hypothetical protein SDC9_76228 [bioreactor metagenome]|uniref:Uncharacterized protein n=1 Tax=bioreactor metagenome TaxID=1076179 RepID=A0A644YNY1_9ZZZZ
MQARSARPEHAKALRFLDLEIVRRTARTQDRLSGCRVVDAVLEQAAVDVHRHHFAQHQPARHGDAVNALQLDDLRALAFHGDRAFGHARRGDLLRRQRCQPAQHELVHLERHGRAALVHGLGQRLGRQVPHELARLLDIGQRVLLAQAGEPQDGRRVVERVEKAVRRQIAHACAAFGGHPANGARADDGVERIVRQAVAFARAIGVKAVGFDGGHGWALAGWWLDGSMLAPLRPGCARARFCAAQSPFSTICSSRSVSAARACSELWRSGPSIISVAMPCTVDHARYSA